MKTFLKGFLGFIGIAVGFYGGLLALMWGGLFLGATFGPWGVIPYILAIVGCVGGGIALAEDGL